MLYVASKAVCHPSTIMKIRDLIANLQLQPISVPESFPLSKASIQDGARLDIAMNGFWGGWFECCYVDVHVFNLYTHPMPIPSLQRASTMRTYKRRAYMANKFVRWNTHLLYHWSFPPWEYGLRGNHLLASLLATKKGDEYCVVMG